MATYHKFPQTLPHWIQLSARTAHRTQRNRYLYLPIYYIIMDMVNYTDEQPDEQIQRAKYVRRDRELPCLLQASYFPRTSMCSPAWKLSELHTIGIFIEASSHRHDQWSTPFPAPLPSLENWGWAAYSKLLIAAWSFWWPSRSQPGAYKELPH